MREYDLWEQRLLVAGLVGVLWISIVAAAWLTLVGREVPQPMYYLATGAFGAITALVRVRMRTAEKVED